MAKSKTKKKKRNQKRKQNGKEEKKKGKRKEKRKKHMIKGFESWPGMGLVLGLCGKHDNGHLNG